MTYFKQLLSFLLLVTTLSAVEISTTATAEGSDIKLDTNRTQKVFGHQLFNGSFATNKQHRYNPNYTINVGDIVNVQMWGALDFQAPLTVDSQGNIFMPKVGSLHVLGIKNHKLTKVLQSFIEKVYKHNVYVYADLQNYQPVSIFVTGSVNKPGLYEGLSSDSVLQFIDKAKGIDSEYGSYRNITVLRDNKELAKIDLYSFLVDGKLSTLQFHMGDVIVVNHISNYVQVTGDVKRPYRIELVGKTITAKELMNTSLPNPSATNFTVTHYTDNDAEVKLYSLKDDLSVEISHGDKVDILPDHNNQSISIGIKGEHDNMHTLVVKKGKSLGLLLKEINFSEFSNKPAIQLFRKSVARIQKQLIESNLKDLEASTLTTGSLTAEESLIRKQEAELVLSFIERARKIEPKGQVVINDNTKLDEIILEDGDTIFIPKTSKMVVVQGEVMLPGAQTQIENMEFSDYILSCGGYSRRANLDAILLLKANGKVVSYEESAWFSNAPKVEGGDSILVLARVESKYLQVVKDMTQIIYQIAVGSAVVLNAF
jgi:protein involved in polysaccharide export with SLBB domain